ncbi:hypothetical protein ACP275_01G042200 [Erythranthe tilingii]
MEKKTYSNPILYLFFYLFTLKIFSTAQIPVRVGVVLDMDAYGNMSFNCISMALLDFYATHGHYNTRLVLINRDSREGVIGAAAAALDLLKNVEVQAIIGPMYSGQANFLISLGQKAQVPIITFAATSPSLSSLRTPYFVRATLKDSSQVSPIVAIIQAFGWREVVHIYEDSEFGEGILPFLTDELEKVNVHIPYRSIFPPLATDDQIAAELYKLMTMQTRVFVVHMLTSLASRLFTKAKQIGMMSKDYAWIITDSITNDLHLTNRSVIDSMLGVIGVQPYVLQTKELDEFRIRYKKSFMESNPRALDVDIYGLWAYDSAIALAMAAEKAILGNTTYREANVSRNSTDLEAIGVSISGPELIQALSSITFTGLAGNFLLVNGELQAPPYQIVNIDGPRASGIGYWTKESGIVKELNFTSADKNTYSTSKSNLRSTIWPGDQSSPPKGWVIPTNGKKLRVGVPNGLTNFVRVTWNSDNSTKVEGYCIDVFAAVMAALPYGVPYEYIPFGTPDHKIAGDYNDLTYQVYLGNYDAVAGDVTIVGNRSQYVDFTLPYIESGISMIVPISDGTRKNAWIFLKPLTWELWLTSFCSFVFIGFLIWILEHRINEDFRGPLWYQIGMIYWFAFSTMVFAHSKPLSIFKLRYTIFPDHLPLVFFAEERVVSNLARFVLIVWFLVVLILTQSYTASLASMLTVQKLEPAVTDITVLMRNKDYVGYSNTSFLHGFLKKYFNESQLRPFYSDDHLDELLSKGSGNDGIAAAFQEIPYIKIFLGKYGSKYMMAGPPYKADGFGFVFPLGSPLGPDVSRAILNVTDGQTMEEIERKWFGDKTDNPDCNTLRPHKNLGLGSFWGLFLIAGIVGVAALIFYVITFLRENWSVIERSGPESTMWSKIVELLHNFDNKDLRSHTFKELQQSERDYNVFCGGCMGRAMNSPRESYQQSPQHLLLGSPRANSLRSPVYGSPSFNRSSAENATTSQQGESSRRMNREIELADRN